MKIKEINRDGIVFDDGTELWCYHKQYCCEAHYIDFESIKDIIEDDLEFDSNKLYEKVDGFGIRLLPTNNFPVPVPGYGVNNGYYSSNITLITILPNGKVIIDDASKCQKIKWTN